MPIHGFSGTVSGGVTETNLFDISDPNYKYYATYIFLDNMANGDSYTIKTYLLDEVANLMKRYASNTYTDIQANPVLFLHAIPTKQIKVSIQKAAGVDKNFNWLRLEVS